MKTMSLNNQSITPFLPLIKEEAAQLLREKDVHSCGVIFLGGPQAIAIWKTAEQEQSASLLYLYVAEECRNMGLGRAMIVHICSRLMQKSITRLDVEYTEQDNRIPLTPFLEAMGGVVDRISYPYGSIAFSEILENASSDKIGKPGSMQAVPFSKLLPSSMKALREIVQKQTGEEAMDYLNNALSLAVEYNGKITAFSLVRQEENIFHLDYFYADQSPKSLNAMFHGIAKQVTVLNMENGVLDMILNNPGSEKAYSLFSKNRAEISIVHASIDPKLILLDARMEALMDAI